MLMSYCLAVQSAYTVCEVIRILPKSGSFKWPSLISLIRLFFAKRETTLIVPINCQYLASYSYPGANPICQRANLIFFFVGNLSRFNVERLSGSKIIIIILIIQVIIVIIVIIFIFLHNSLIFKCIIFVLGIKKATREWLFCGKDV